MMRSLWKFPGCLSSSGNGPADVVVWCLCNPSFTSEQVSPNFPGGIEFVIP